MAGPVQITKDANKYLNQEVAKRWKIITVKPPYGSSSRPKGALTEDGLVVGFKIHEYWSHRLDGKICLRVKEKFRGECYCEPYNADGTLKYSHFNSRTEEERNKSDSVGLELTFLSDEIETVIPWLLDNYLEVKTIPEWISEKNTDRIKVGEPAFFYLWTKKADTSYEKGLKRA